MKPTLFLLPGLMCDRGVWTHQVQSLQMDADILVPVFRGLRSLSDMAGTVLRLAPQRFSVVGHSMGGRVAMEVIRQAGDRVDRLALLDTGVHPLAPGEAEKRQTFLDVARKEGMHALAAAWIPGMVHPERLQDTTLIAKITDMVMRNSLTDFEGQIEALISRPDARELLSTIRCPTLVACGREDGWAVLAQHEEMARLVPDSELAVFEHCGHMAPMEQPEQVTELLRRWLN